MVGVAGFEPTTPTPPAWCATSLRYTPTFLRGTIMCNLLRCKGRLVKLWDPLKIIVV